MRELLYLSTAKLNAIAPRPGSAGAPINEIEVTVVGLRLRVSTGQRLDELPWRRLRIAEKRLEKIASDLDAAAPPTAGDWIRFDSMMAADLSPTWVDDLDIALFAADHRTPGGDVALLLCGSALHLVTHPRSTDPTDGYDSRSGSIPDPTWFRPPQEDGRPRQIGSIGWQELNERRRDHSAHTDASLDAFVENAQSDSGSYMLTTAYALHRAVAAGPTALRAPMRGLARVLLAGSIRPPDADEPLVVVLASPIAVEYSR